MTSNEHERAKPLRTGDPHELGDYRIVGRLGRGGMGTVYLAEDASERFVAVKLIHPDLTDDEDFRRRFAREVQSARRVARFSTAGVIDAELESDPLYIVSEYVPGPNLSEAINTEGPMRGGTLESLAMGVAAALTAIHGAGVIHRDLKPANVLLSTVGPKVIDFGIARAMDDDGSVTRSSQLMGTPAYLAPELVTGGEITPVSDIFSWGCLIAFAGTGRAPFDAQSVPAVLQLISAAPPNLEGLDPSLEDVVLQALEKDPAHRPTAQQLLNRLVGQENPTESVVDRTVVRSWTPPSTPRPDGAAAGAAGIAGAAAAEALPETAAGPTAAMNPNNGQTTRAMPPETGQQLPPTAALGQQQPHPADPYAAQGQVASGPQQPPYGPPPSESPVPGPPPGPGFGAQPPYGQPSGPQQPPYGAPPQQGGQPMGAQPPGYPSPGMQSPPYGQQSYAPMGPGGPGAPGGPGQPPTGANPSASPAPASGGGRKKKMMIYAAVGAVVLLMTSGIVGSQLLIGPEFPTGTNIFTDEFGNSDSGWKADDYDVPFDATEHLRGYTDDDQYALRATTDDTLTRAISGFPGDYPEQLAISVDTSVQNGPAYGETEVYCFYNDDDDTRYSVTVRFDGSEARIRRIGGEAGISTLEQVTEGVPGYEVAEDGQEDADKPVNTLQVTCERQEEESGGTTEKSIAVRLWVNGTHVMDAVDTQPIQNGVTGLGVAREGGGSGGDAIVYFDNYRMNKLEPEAEATE
ncbi:serine/threonine protein kinase [Nocardiopsis gilva YIM 90087]|uniref:Serine/threonine protein kinase n=1 Tax=Nocardiopsis gilva YIM 90087 TaxID=1235441 RepID=A0A223S4J0_9ACTN|nr:serine/threonine-protein kinase [Nocardiopsis gilva]ASU83035.1 serine/threonine protein kinase [Nocardiopsis gilva YIM 90087]